jgi:hypothetical protein
MPRSVITTLVITCGIYEFEKSLSMPTRADSPRALVQVETEGFAKVAKRAGYEVVGTPGILVFHAQNH